LKTETVLQIGFDDTDSPKGMCTTYLAYKIVDLLKREQVGFLDFPTLIRFNPNIPWKTRGNGAVGLKIKTKNPEKIKKKVTNLVKKYSDVENGANPALVFFENETVPKQFNEFSKLALWKLISRKHAKKFAAQTSLESFYLGNGQGLVGAIGAIGYEFADHTLELLSYRKKSQFGKQRRISSQSVRHIQNSHPKIFNSYDYKKKRVLITPHGPDPVFYGLRGEEPYSLLAASKLIKTKEKLDGYLIFKSNQGTSDHLQNEIPITEIKPYVSGTLTGIVCTTPVIEKGGHVIFQILTHNVKVYCAVYKPTGITNYAKSLILGDKVRIGGGVRKASKKHPRIINVEFFQVLEMQKDFKIKNPICEHCKKSMKSKGKQQGFECVKCGKKSFKKYREEIPRKIKKTIYLPIPSAHRHLTRPEQRIGIKNNKTKFQNSIPWFVTYKN